MVFLGIRRHLQATAVAREMGLTQLPSATRWNVCMRSTMTLCSRAAPTALACDLEPKIRRIVRQISETLSDEPELDPTETVINMRVGAFDYEHTTIIAELIAEIRALNTNIGIHTYPLNNRDAPDTWVHGRIDIASGDFNFPITCTETFIAE